mgnify:CR=1 FL=1
MRSWMTPEGTAGRGRTFRRRASPSRPRRPPERGATSAQPPPGSPEPPPHRGLTFGTRTAFSPIRLRGDPSSLEDNAVLDRKVRPGRRHGRRQHERRRAGGEELRLRTAPGRRVGARARRRRRLSLAPTRESSRSCSLSSSSPRSPRCPQQHPGSRRRRHHRRRHRSAPWPRSPRRTSRHRPPPRPEHRPPP